MFLKEIVKKKLKNSAIIHIMNSASIEFTQDELKYLLGVINIALNTGKLSIGDIMIVAPIINKVDIKIVKLPAESKSEEKVFSADIKKN